MSEQPVTIPRERAHVAYGPKGVSAERADCDYLREAARNIAFSRCLGSNLTATVVAILHTVADQLEDRVIHPEAGPQNHGCGECMVAGGHYPSCPAACVVIDEDTETQAAFLRSLGLDPATATLSDLERVLRSGIGNGAT